MSIALDGGYFDYRTPSNIVEKYSPDGATVWQKALEENASSPNFMPAVWNDEIGIPLYKNGMLYVPVDHGIIALNKNGTVAWTKKFSDDYTIFNLMPIDSRGNLYLEYRITLILTVIRYSRSSPTERSSAGSLRTRAYDMRTMGSCTRMVISQRNF